MPLEQLANIAEIFGMFVITITIIFLTMQMRQNTIAMRSAATREAHQQLAQYYEMLATNDDVRDTMIKGLSDPAALSETETSRFFSSMMIPSINFQNWIHQTQSGAMEGEILSSYSRLIQSATGTPGWRVFWEERKYVFSSTTQNHVEELVQRGPDRPYAPLGVSQDQ